MQITASAAASLLSTASIVTHANLRRFGVDFARKSHLCLRLVHPQLLWQPRLHALHQLCASRTGRVIAVSSNKSLGEGKPDSTPGHGRFVASELLQHRACLCVPPAPAPSHGAKQHSEVGKQLHAEVLTDVLPERVTREWGVVEWHERLTQLPNPRSVEIGALRAYDGAGGELAAKRVDAAPQQTDPAAPVDQTAVGFDRSEPLLPKCIVPQRGGVADHNQACVHRMQNTLSCKVHAVATCRPKLPNAF
eukprot:5718882-Pleurochrysis_carterae.AAC.1